MEKKKYGFTIQELVFLIFALVFVFYSLFYVFYKTRKIETNDVILENIYEKIVKGLNENNASNIKTHSKNWEWLSANPDIAANYILNKRLLPNVGAIRSCKNNLDCVLGFSYTNVEEYERVNFRRDLNYARALVGMENFHIALALTGTCKKGNKKSVCAVVIIDVNNKEGPNIMGYDVFKFAFYGDGQFLPFGYYLSDETVEENCQKEAAGETCAAKIMRDNWRMKKEGDNAYFIYKNRYTK